MTVRISRWLLNIKNLDMQLTIFDEIRSNFIKGQPHSSDFKLPLYKFRANIIDLFAKLDFYFIQKSKFNKKSDRGIENSSYRPGTLGFLIQKRFYDKGNSLVYGKEHHDFLHCLLDLDFSPEGEAMLHAYLLGSCSVGGYTYPFLIANLLILPETFSQIRNAYTLGKGSNNIRDVDLKKYLDSEPMDLWIALCCNMKITPQL